MIDNKGKEIYEQLLKKLYREKAPTIYTIGKFLGISELDMPRVYSTLAFLSRKYRRTAVVAGQESLIRINATSEFVHRAEFIRYEHTRGSAVSEVEKVLNDYIAKGEHVSDRDMVAFIAAGDFYSNERNFRTQYAGYDTVKQMRERIAASSKRIDLVPIIAISPFDTDSADICTTNSIVFSSFNDELIITLFGSKDDEVYSFVEKAGVLTAFPSDLICQYGYIERARETRFLFFSCDNGTTIMANLFAAYGPAYSQDAHYFIPTYKEKFSLVNAATIPFGEAIRLAIPIEHSIDVTAATPHKRTHAELAEEAIAAWTAGKYITCNDTTQPGLSRTGSIVYISKLLGEIIVLSFNLKLPKEKKQ